MGLVFNGTSGTDKISAVDGTLTIDGVATINSITSPIITGDLSISDTIVHTGDTNTKIRFPSADTFTVETAGSERIRIDSSGKMGLGTNNPNNPLTIHASGNHIFLKDTATNNVLQIRHASGVAEFNSYDLDGNARRDYVFNQYSSEALRIDSSGRLLIGTTTEGHGDADNLTIRDSGNCGITIRSSDVGWGTLYFSDSTSGAGEYDGFINYSQQHQYLKIGTASVERLRITSAGDVGIGTVTPGGDLHIWDDDSSARIYITSGNSNDSSIYFGRANDTATAAIRNDHSDNSLRFYGYNNSERLRIDSSGNVGIGTDAVSSLYQRQLQINSTTTGGAALHLTNASSGQSNSDGFHLVWQGHLYHWLREDANQIFATNGSERLTIENTGEVLIATTTNASVQLDTVGSIRAQAKGYVAPTSGVGLE